MLLYITEIQGGFKVMKRINIRKQILALLITIISILGISNVYAADTAPSSLKM